MIKAESTKSQELAKVKREIKIRSQHQYWCHVCQYRFSENLNPGQDEVFCPKCGDDFCEIFTDNSRPNQFQPYQKPLKSHPRKIPKLTSQIVLMALAQLEYDAQVEKIRQISPQDIKQLRINVELEIGKELQQCIICKQQMEIGCEGLKCPCSHIFHLQCLSEWLQYKNTCPKCRQKVFPQNTYNK